MSSLSTLPKGDSAWLLRKSIQRIMQQVSVLETNIGSSTTGNSANTQVIFNDNGTLRGDTGLTFNKTTDTLGTGRLTTSGDAIVCSSTGDFYVGTTLSPQFKVERATGAATITGNLTVDTNTFFADSANDRVGVGTATPAVRFNIADSDNAANGTIRLGVGAIYSQIKMAASSTGATEFTNVGNGANGAYNFSIDGQNQYKIATSGVFTWFDGAGGTRMTLNATGLGVGTSNFAYKINAAGFIAAVDPSFTGTGGSLIGAMLNNDNTAPGLDLRRWTGTAGTHGTTYIATDATGATFFYNGQQASNTKATSLKMTLDASGNLSLQSDKYFGWGNLDSLIYGSSTSNYIYFRTNATERVRVKGGGQLRFIPLAADPAGAEAGDVYYNSSSNKLKCYNGTTWNDLF